jgi:hypothetical protein
MALIVPSIKVMMTLLPPLPATETTSTTIDITNFIQNIGTSKGRQHELQQIEPSTIQLLITNRTGIFSPWNQTSPFANRIPYLTSTFTNGTLGTWHLTAGTSVAAGGGGPGLTPLTMVLNGTARMGWTPTTGAFLPVTLGIPVVGGAVYTIRSQAKRNSSAGTSGVTMTVHWYNSLGVTVSNSNVTFTCSASGFSKHSGQVTAPATAAHALISFATTVSTLICRPGFTKRYVTAKLSGGHLDVAAWAPGGENITIGSTISVQGNGTQSLAYAYVTTLVPLIPDDISITLTVLCADALKLFANQTVNCAFYPGLVMESNPVLYWRGDDGPSAGVAFDFALRGSVGIVKSPTLVNLGGPSSLTDDLGSSITLSPHGSAPTPFISCTQLYRTLTEPGTNGFSVEWWWRPTFAGVPKTGANVSAYTQLKLFGTKTFSIRCIMVNNVVSVSVLNGAGTFQFTSGTAYTYTATAPAPWLHFALTYTRAAKKVVLYVNGVKKATGTSTTAFQLSTFTGFGMAEPSTAVAVAASSSNVAVYGTTLTATTIEDHYLTGTTSPFFVTDSGTAIKLLLLGAGIPVNRLTIEIGNSEINLVGAITVGTSTLMSVIQQISGSEQGSLFQTFINLVFWNRNHAISASASINSNGTFSNSASATLHYLPGIQPARDDLTLWNEVPTKNQSASSGYLVKTVPSQRRWGRRTLQGYTATVYENSQTAVALGQWLLATYKTPYDRLRAISLSSVVNTGKTIAQQAQRGFLDLITTNYQPPTPGTPFSQEAQIESIKHTIVPGILWKTDWVLTPYTYGETSWLILNTATRGKLGGATEPTIQNRLAF